MNEGPSGADSSKHVGRVSSAAWSQWTPVNAAAIGLYLVGCTVLLLENRSRVASQRGVAIDLDGSDHAHRSSAGRHGVLTRAGAALDQSKAPGRVGRRVERRCGGSRREAAQSQLRLLQWAIPALTGAMLVTNAVLGEQQRPSNVARGIFQRAAYALPGL